jgi:TPR repeat protein
MKTYILAVFLLLLAAGTSSPALSECGNWSQRFEDFKMGEEAGKSGKLAQAAYRFKCSAEAGYAPAQFYLGLMYLQGLGVKKNDENAFELFEDAAEQGNPLSQLNLGLMLSSGRGTQKDLIYGHMWLSLGVAQGVKAGKEHIITLEKRMSTYQLETSQSLIRQCVSSRYKGC